MNPANPGHCRAARRRPPESDSALRCPSSKPRAPTPHPSAPAQPPRTRACPDTRCPASPPTSNHPRAPPGSSAPPPYSDRHPRDSLAPEQRRGDTPNQTRCGAPGVHPSSIVTPSAFDMCSAFVRAEASGSPSANPGNPRSAHPAPSDRAREARPPKTPRQGPDAPMHSTEPFTTAIPPPLPPHSGTAPTAATARAQAQNHPLHGNEDPTTDCIRSRRTRCPPSFARQARGAPSSAATPRTDGAPSTDGLTPPITATAHPVAACATSACALRACRPSQSTAARRLLAPASRYRAEAAGAASNGMRAPESALPAANLRTRAREAKHPPPGSSRIRTPAFDVMAAGHGGQRPGARRPSAVQARATCDGVLHWRRSCPCRPLPSLAVRPYPHVLNGPGPQVGSQPTTDPGRRPRIISASNERRPRR
jgi:hypothetical protein